MAGARDLHVAATCKSLVPAILAVLTVFNNMFRTTYITESSCKLQLLYWLNTG